MNDANEQLRQLFSPLARPNPSKWFLYDMAAHVTDSIFFDVTCKTPNDLDTWYKVYAEMYHSAYDTSSLLKDEDIYNAAHTFKNDTIPIGIMNYDFFRLKPDALTTDKYFYFDTVNTVLTDIPNRSNEPYSEASIFMASPLYQSSHFRNPIFRIDPQFILYDVFNQAKYSNMGEGELRIDFGDGNGWVLLTHKT